MRIAVVGYPLLSRRQWALYTELPNDDIHLLTPQKWPTAFESDFPKREDQVTLHKHRSLFNGQMGRYLLPGIFSTLRDLNPDIVLTHGEPWYLNTAYCQLMCELLTIPHVIFSWENLVRMPQMRVQRSIEQIILSRVDGIIAGSATAKERFRTVGYSGAISVAPESGIDTDRFRPDLHNQNLLDRFDIPAHSEIVLYTGRLVEEKGVELLLETGPRVFDACPKAHYLILGSGPREDHLQELIEDLDIEENVSLITERQPYNEMPAIHSLASAFVYPSRTTDTWAEQFGFAVAEAMSSGVPVITTECGSLPNVVGDAGIVCSENDIDELREALIHLLQDDSRRSRISDEARERAVDEFSLTSVAEKQRRFLAKVVSRKSHRDA